MRILSRYILRNFLFWLVISSAGFLALFVIVDLIDHLDNFIDRKTSLLLVVEYYLYFLPYNAALCLPIAMLLSTLFTLGGLAKNNEILAMKASGITLYRIFAPILVLASLVSGAVFLADEILIPFANERKEEIWRATKGKPPRIGNQQNVILQDVDGQIVFAGYYDAEKRSARNVSIERYSGPSLSKRIVGKRMMWTDGKWRVEEGEIWEFEGGRERAARFDTLRVTSLTLLPSDFERRRKDPEEMSYRELRRYIERVRRNGGDATRWLVDLYLKVSFPLTNFIIVLFGAPVSTSTRRTGKALNFGLSIFISFVYYGFIKSGQALGRNGIMHPVPAAWMANVLFFGLAVVLLVRARK